MKTSSLPFKTQPFLLSPPTSLGEISQPPSKLWALGDDSVFKQPCFAIVGTRRPSAYGIRAALYFSKRLAALGFTIVSGLARGIDSYAHRGALLANGRTVAVLGSGLHYIYPPENVVLVNDIVKSGGCVVSEYENTDPPLKHHFPQRNRIISGLSLGVLIIEAAEKSGSLITAQCALDQNREVFVVGSRFDEFSFKGGNLLLQQGAKMVLDIADILEEFSSLELFNVKESEAIAASDSCLSKLQKLFHTVRGGISMAELYSMFPEPKADYLSLLEVAIQEKKVVEAPSQQFFWID